LLREDIEIGQLVTSMRPRHWLALGLVVLAAGLVASWLSRRPLTEAVIRSYLADKGVDAAYRVAEADSRHLVFENVALGPVGNRDFVAQRISVDLAVWIASSRRPGRCGFRRSRPSSPMAACPL
jgi:hypothetical protein